MIITYHGGAMVKISQGDQVLVFNPISKESKLKPAKFGADVALISLNDPDYNGADQLSYGERQPFVANGPGEYETRGIFIKGFPSTGADGKINTIYQVIWDDLRLVHLGGLADDNLPDERIEELGAVDILFVPVSTRSALPAKAAHKLALSIAPAAILPLGDGDSLKAFAKEAGEEKAPAIDKYVIKKKDLVAEGSALVILNQV